MGCVGSENSSHLLLIYSTNVHDQYVLYLSTTLHGNLFLSKPILDTAMKYDRMNKLWGYNPFVETEITGFLEMSSTLNVKAYKCDIVKDAITTFTRCLRLHFAHIVEKS